MNNVISIFSKKTIDSNVLEVKKALIQEQVLFDNTLKSISEMLDLIETANRSINREPWINTVEKLLSQQINIYQYFSNDEVLKIRLDKLNLLKDRLNLIVDYYDE